MKSLAAAVAVLALLTLILAAPAAAGLGPRLERTLAGDAADPPAADGSRAVWVYFKDKNITADRVPAALAAAADGLSQRALDRRRRASAAGASAVDLRDLPVAPAYLAAVGATGARPRRTSSWLNAASFDADEAQIRAINRLPCVEKVELVITFLRPVVEIDPAEAAAIGKLHEGARDKSSGLWSLDYGLSTGALEQVNVPPVHEMGLTGSGVIVAELDAGFALSHECLQHIPILAQHDFVHDDGSVEYEEGDHAWQHRHGSQVLSTIMGFKEGGLVGPAYGASVILAMTEDTGDETQIEEDNWVAAVEWVEGLGADLITSSLGYYYWYTYEDLDGDTAVITVAADLAVARGLSVFTSAGNERENPDFPHVLAPADGDSVIACGAVDPWGNIASFSSPGPTVDGRIKPDVSALGVGSIVASYEVDTAYMAVNGTSFAAPMIAGVAALMLERTPELTPMQIREALRQTASMAAAPNNDFGWGVIDALAAVTYWGASIGHTPLPDTEDAAGPYACRATITSRAGLDPAELFLYWRLDGGTWNQVPLATAGGDTFLAQIPGQPGGLVEYYLEAGDVDGIVIQAPQGGPDHPWSFGVGTDQSAPVLSHYSLTDQVPANWPPLLMAEATDNQAVAQVVVEFSVNGGPVQGPVPLVGVGDTYSLAFPLAPGAIAAGDVITYTLTAHDTAAVANTASSGPWEVRILETLGKVLVIDDSVFGALKDGQGGDGPAALTPGTDMAQWLVEMGYTVTVVAPEEVDPTDLNPTDAVFLTSSNNAAPINLPLMRAYLIDYVEGGGKIVVEGGALAAICYNYGGYYEFARTVLRAQGWLGAATIDMRPTAGQETHPVLVRPNRLAIPIVQDQSANPYDDAGGDGVTVVPGSHSLLRSAYNTSWQRAIYHDDNTAPEAGQVVFLAVAFIYLEPDQARNLPENSLAYLLAREAPGAASISGTVTLAGGGDAAGATVSCSGGTSTIAGPGGGYTLDGLHGSSYTVTVTLAGYGPVARTVILGQYDALTGVDFTLHPITEVNLTAAPEMAIPDFNAAGVTSVIQVPGPGLVHDLSIDIDIAHPSIGQLEVSLTSPAGTRVMLHDNTGATADDLIGNWPTTLIVDGPGSLADFLDEPVQGAWTLTVADLNFGARGTLHSWGLNLQVKTDLVSAVPGGTPLATRLLGNVPNPFNPQTVIAFELAKAGPVRLDIHDVRGRRVRRLADVNLAAGRHQLSWDGRDGAGRSVASGVYFCRLQAEDASRMIKMTLVR